MIKRKIKDILGALSPTLYKKALFKKYDKLNWSNLADSNAESEILLLQYLLNKDSVFFDVGSNIGAYLYVANKYTVASAIYGFEPIPKLYRNLKKAFSGMHIYPVALSNEEKQKQFKIPTIDGVKLMPRGTLNTEYIEDGEMDSTVFDVKTMRLDTFVETHGIHTIDLIKIDVEGHELTVIEGARKTIAQFSPTMIIEIEQRHHHMDLNEIIDSIQRMGYTCCYFDITDFAFKQLIVDATSIQHKADHKKSRKYVNNFVFLPAHLNPDSKIELINTQIKNQLL